MRMRGIALASLCLTLGACASTTSKPPPQDIDVELCRLSPVPMTRRFREILVISLFNCTIPAPGKHAKSNGKPYQINSLYLHRG